MHGFQGFLHQDKVTFQFHVFMNFWAGLLLNKRLRNWRILPETLNLPLWWEKLFWDMCYIDCCDQMCVVRCQKFLKYINKKLGVLISLTSASPPVYLFWSSSRCCIMFFLWKWSPKEPPPFTLLTFSPSQKTGKRRSVAFVRNILDNAAK